MGVASEKRGPIQAVERVDVQAGKGIVGDRYPPKFAAEPDYHGPHREITLIELEAIEALERDHQITLSPIEARRNVVTQGVALNHLVNQEFIVGTSRLRGIELCEPCTTLESMTQKGIIGGLVHRGGLRAQVLTDGEIAVGDRILPAK